MARGDKAQQRRRQRRHRGSAAGSKRALSPVTELTAATANTPSFKDLPLSARDQDWNGVAADADGLFVGQVDGQTVAVWRAVVACAGALQGARGTAGVIDQLEKEERLAMINHVERYYAKARSVYDDPSIVTPWAAEGAADVHAVVFALAGAEVRRAAPDSDLLERLHFWADQFDAKLVELDPDVSRSSENVMATVIGQVAYEIVELDAEEKAVAAAHRAFAKPPVSTETPVEATLAADDMERCADCGHTADMHDAGSCTVDGCDCTGMSEASEETTAAVVTLDDLPEVAAFKAGVLDGHTSLRDQFGRAFERTLAELPEEQAEQINQRLTFHIGELQLVDGVTAETEASLPDQPGGLGQRWQALIVPEGTMTDDFRAFAPGSVSWRQLPLTLAAMLDTPHADVVTKAEACGRIDRIWRDGNDIRAEGVFNPDAWGQKIAAMVTDQSLRGISVDIAIAESEVAPRSDFFDEDGVWRSEREHSENELDMLDLLFGEDTGDQPIFVVTDGTIGSVTICPFAAFAQATIGIAASLTASVQRPNVWTVTTQHGMIVTGGSVIPASLAQDDLIRGLSMGDTINRAQPELVAAVAAEVAVRPPAEWFDDPELEVLTPLTVDEDGRIYGHAAPWGVCHIGIPDVCTTAPHSATDYEGFLLKEILCDDGESFAVGTITLGTGHASRGKNAFEAVEHYDNTGSAVADVTVGEDGHGIWVAGALRPGLDEETVRALRGAVLSGDWRQMRLDDGSRNLELVALLAVNVPGFPVPRTRALVAAGDDGLEVVALVAAGIHFGESEEAKLNKIRALADVAAGRYAEVLAKLEAA